jgi:hypothetical protein
MIGQTIRGKLLSYLGERERERERERDHFHHLRLNCRAFDCELSTFVQELAAQFEKTAAELLELQQLSPSQRDDVLSAARADMMNTLFGEEESALRQEPRTQQQHRQQDSQAAEGRRQQTPPPQNASASGGLTLSPKADQPRDDAQERSAQPPVLSDREQGEDETSVYSWHRTDDYASSPQHGVSEAALSSRALQPEGATNLPQSATENVRPQYGPQPPPPQQGNPSADGQPQFHTGVGLKNVPLAVPKDVISFLHDSGVAGDDFDWTPATTPPDWPYGEL